LVQYLALTGLPHAAPGVESGRGVWAAFPDLSVPHPRIFSTLHEAIRTHCSVQIIYRSMRDPKPHQRVISPHSLVRAGRRWHVRAYCQTNQDFRDYALGRIAEVKLLTQPAERGEQDDNAWTARVNVRLVAHPNLSPDQEAVIRFEYFNNTAARVETCRGALVGYFIQDMRAAIDVKKQRPPDYQLAVANFDEVSPWLFPA
jgi:predicted DNA-binding transcriptional regulator YafY